MRVVESRLGQCYGVQRKHRTCTMSRALELLIILYSIHATATPQKDPCRRVPENSIIFYYIISTIFISLRERAFPWKLWRKALIVFIIKPKSICTFSPSSSKCTLRYIPNFTAISINAPAFGHAFPHPQWCGIILLERHDISMTN